MWGLFIKKQIHGTTFLVVACDCVVVPSGTKTAWGTAEGPQRPKEPNVGESKNYLNKALPRVKQSSMMSWKKIGFYICKKFIHENNIYAYICCVYQSSPTALITNQYNAVRSWVQNQTSRGHPCERKTTRIVCVENIAVTSYLAKLTWDDRTTC